MIFNGVLLDLLASLFQDTAYPLGNSLCLDIELSSMGHNLICLPYSLRV